MPKIMTLTLGDNELSQAVVDWRVDFVPETALSVKLTASIKTRPTIPIFGPRGKATLAIQMDRAVAIALSQQICELARSMGWLPPPAESQT